MNKILPWRRAIIFAWLIAGALPAKGAGTAGSRFVIDNDGDFPEAAVRRARTQLESGLADLTRLGIPLREKKFPITVHLKEGRGVSKSFHGAGPIMLYYVAKKQSPIIHELTHMMAGYTRANGHWTEEGLASYVQDRFGEDVAYPTRKRPHAVMKVILEENAALPMIEVMKDRGRSHFFTHRNLWHNWLAYSQSSSFVTYLVETYGMAKFMGIYDRPYEKQDFVGQYGKSAQTLVDEWQAYVRSLRRNLTVPRRIFDRVRKATARSGGHPPQE